MPRPITWLHLSDLHYGCTGKELWEQIEVEFFRDVPVTLKIHETTEKYLLREAARPVLTDTVYRRRKHPFLAPPATETPAQPLAEMLQDTMRSSTLARIPFYDQAKMIALLDRLPQMSARERTATDPVLMMALSACVLHERFGL